MCQSCGTNLLRGLVMDSSFKTKMTTMSSRRRAREAHANCEPGRSADPKVLLAGVSANMTRKRIVRVFVGVMLALVCQAAAIYVAVPIMAASGVRPISLFYTSPPLPRRPLLVVGAVGSGTTAMAADLRAISLNIAHEDNGWASGKDGAVAWMVRVPLQPLAPFPPLLAPLASSTTYLPPIAYHPTTPQRHDPTTSPFINSPTPNPHHPFSSSCVTSTARFLPTSWSVCANIQQRVVG